MSYYFIEAVRWFCFVGFLICLGSLMLGGLEVLVPALIVLLSSAKWTFISLVACLVVFISTFVRKSDAP